MRLHKTIFYLTTGFMIFCLVPGISNAQTCCSGGVPMAGNVGGMAHADIIPYDRETDSNWSQMLLKAVNGPLKGTPAETYNLLETRWDTWKSMYPGTRVLSSQTGYNRNYTAYPYGNYKTSNSLIFPVNNEDQRLHPKERVLMYSVRR